ncbi:MAG TPA: hypothetical protein ENI23_13375 [bacterium]|nr:hypothetical protein [bacterium]
MSSPRAGKLLKQGSVATLTGYSANEQDRFIFDGQQFINLSSQRPKVVKASAAKGVLFAAGEISTSSEYPNFKDENGEFRFTNGNPTTVGVNSGWPKTYDHIVIQFNNTVTTSEIKFWSIDYIPTGYIKVDYGYSDDKFYNISAASATYIFDDSVKQYGDESVTRGLYVYTISLGQEYTARYWRISSFVTAVTTSTVTSPIDGKNVPVDSTTGWPDTDTDFSSGEAHIMALIDSSSLYKENTTYGDVTSNPDGTYSLENLKFSGDVLGTASAGSIITVQEKVYKLAWSGDWWDPGSVLFWSAFEVSDIDTAVVLDSVDVSISPFYADVTIDSSLIPFTDRREWVAGLVYGVTTELTYSLARPPRISFTYSSKTGSQFTTIDTSYPSDKDLPSGSTLVFSYPMNISQVEVTSLISPTFTFWNSDGSESLVKEIQVDDIYDIVFDKGDDVFYLIRFSGSGGIAPSVSDSFSEGLGSTVNLDRWSVVGNGFRRDGNLETLVFEKDTVAGAQVFGSVLSNTYFDSSFTGILDVGITTLSGSNFYGLVSRERTSENQESGVYIIGDWEQSSDRSFVAVGLSQLVNATDGKGDFRNFVFSPYNLPEGLHRHSFEYSTSSWLYARTALSTAVVGDISGENSGLGPTLIKDGFSLKLDSNPDIVAGHYISFVTSKTTVSGINNDFVQLQQVFDGSLIFTSKYKDGGGSLTTLQSSEVVGTEYKVEIVGNTGTYANVTASGFDFTGSSQSEIPTLRIEALDADGNNVEVVDTTDSTGVVISTFDVLGNYGLEFGDFYNKISISTTGQTEAAGGSIFLRVGRDVYKYNKTALPLAVSEKGGNAVLLYL